MPLIYSFLLTFLVLACGLPASAQVVPADSSERPTRAPRDSAKVDGRRPHLEARLGEITVTASRLHIDVAAAPQRVTILDQADIERMGARSVGELLASRAGLFIRQYGEGLSTVSLRGAGPSQALVLLDGMRLADPQLGQLDLSLFPTYALSAVEVLHGPGSALHGADGIGGIVNLRPRSALENGARLSSEVGAFGERRMGGGASLRGGAAGAILAAEYAEADGDFRYVNESLFPPREVRRRNADRRTRSLFASSFLESGRHRIQLAVLAADAERGLPGLATTGPAGERQWDQHVRIWMRDEVSLPSGRLAVRGFVHRSRLRYVNPGLGTDDTGRTWSGAVEAERVVPLSAEWMFDGGLSTGFAQAEHPMLSEAASEMSASAFGEAVGNLGPLSVYPALRADAYGIGSSTRRIAVSPRLGANVPLLARRMHVKASFGRAFRNPTFNERYWRQGGNPDLHAERAWSFEGGVHFAIGGEAPRSGGGRTAATVGAPAFGGELTVFHTQTTNQIIWTPGGNGVWVPENVTTTATRGVEASLHAGTVVGSAMVDGGATYSLTHSVDRSDPDGRTFDRQLRYVPRHLFKGFAGLAVGAVRFDASARWIGRRYVTADESEWLDPSLVVDLTAGAHRYIGRFRADLAAVLQNALDAEYSVIQNYPMPPRHVRIRLVIQASENAP